MAEVKRQASTAAKAGALIGRARPSREVALEGCDVAARRGFMDSAGPRETRQALSLSGAVDPDMANDMKNIGYVSRIRCGTYGPQKLWTLGQLA